MSDGANQNTDEALNLDDPESWPIDVAGLAGLADGDPPAEKAPEKAAVAPGADDGAGGAAAAGKDPKAAAAAAALEDGKEDPKGVLTADGKHIIPYGVLKTERDARQEAEAQLAALTQELAALKGGGAQGAEGTTQKPAAASSDDDIPAEVKAKVAQLRDDFGDEFADNFLDTWRTKQQVAAVQAWIETVQADRAAAEDSKRQTTEQTVQQAIDAVPVLAEWQVDAAHPEWYQAANQMHEMLMGAKGEAGNAYRAMSWAERMAELPSKVEAVYGESPHSAKHRAGRDNTKTAADAIANAQVRRPVSISEIPGGTPPAGSEMEKLENMTPAQLQATVDSMAARGADGLERFLSQVSV